MRINQYVAQNSILSRRQADEAIKQGRVQIDGKVAKIGDSVLDNVVKLDHKIISNTDIQKNVVIFNKPVGYVCSKNGQGNKTIYDILPQEFRNYNSIGRLDKDSSGLLLLTNDGQLAYELSHPKFKKIKIYQVTLNKSLSPLHQQMINDYGINLDDGPSKLTLEKQNNDKNFRVLMHEGRNRQIRRTFATLGYEVEKLHRIQFGDYNISQLKNSEFKIV